MFENTKGVIRSRKSRKDRNTTAKKYQHVIRSRKSKKVREYNGQKKKYKGQTTIYKT